MDAAVLNMEKNSLTKKIPAKLFLLYISMASMIMLFSSMFSALVVRKGDYKKLWLDITLPSTFLTSTIVILISSITLQYALKKIKSKTAFQTFGFMTLILAFVFVFLQWMGWKELADHGILYTGHPSGSFVYFISFVHGLHYVGGIFFLGLLLFRYRKIEADENQVLNFKILTQYWHFIGIIWVCIYLFFKFIIYK